MPQDLFKWEDAGALVHHCPQCFKPLTTPQSRSRCLGHHVECCKNYHTQLFRKGTSAQCEPCRRTEEEHEKRHRGIAELLHELKQLKAEQAPPASPLTPRALNTLAHPNTPGTESPMTKKGRKAAKKATKISAMPKVVSSADIAFVATKLHPHTTDLEGEEVDLEGQLLEDPDINLNRFFHKNTSSIREVRREIVLKDRQGSKAELKVNVDELQRLLQLLDVSPLAPTASADEKAIHVRLTDRIEKDVVQVQREQEQMMVRKRGFWRWASKKAYNRLVANGRIWGEKGPAVGKADGSHCGCTSSSSSSSALAGAEEAETSDEVTEAETDVTTPTEEGVDEKMAGLRFAKERSGGTASNPNAVVPSTPTDDGWTTIGKPGKLKKRPVGNLKLVHNRGLSKLAQIPTPKKRRGFVGLNDGQLFDESE